MVVGPIVTVWSSVHSVSSAGVGVASIVASPFSPDGLGVGGILAAVALIYLFGYLDLLSSAESEKQELVRTLRALIIPLSIVFISIIVYNILLVG